MIQYLQACLIVIASQQQPQQRCCCCCCRCCYSQYVAVAVVVAAAFLHISLSAQSIRCWFFISVSHSFAFTINSIKVLRRCLFFCFYFLLIYFQLPRPILQHFYGAFTALFSSFFFLHLCDFCFLDFLSLPLQQQAMGEGERPSYLHAFNSISIAQLIMRLAQLGTHTHTRTHMDIHFLDFPCACFSWSSTERMSDFYLSLLVVELFCVN